MTAATPTGSFQLNTKIPADLSEFVVLLELNKSFDYNATFSEERLEDPSKSHAEKEYSGQPSLIYAATIHMREKPYAVLMELLGHSDPTGETGELFPDTLTLDTALEIVDRILVEL